MDANYNKLKNEVADELLKNTNVLIQGRYGEDNNDLVLDSIEKAGLRLFSMELGDPSKVRKGAWKDATEEEKEKRIRSFVKDEKATALLVDMHPARVNEVTTFSNVAKELGIPLIVSMTSGADLKADFFSTKELLEQVVKGDEPKLNTKESAISAIQSITKTEKTAVKNKKAM